MTSFFYEHISSAYRGGYLRFIKQYLERIPIVTSNADECEQLSALAERQLALHARQQQSAGRNEQGDLQEQIEATDWDIDRLVYELYGLTEEEIGIVEESVGS